MTNNQPTQTLRMADFHNRFVDLKMEGSWGYNPHRGIIITAESYIEELEVTSTKVLDDFGEVLDVFVLFGTDKYGRELEIPMDKVLAVGFLDTKDQARLKGFKGIKEDALDGLGEDINKPEFKIFKDMLDDYKELVDKGVTLYKRKG